MHLRWGWVRAVVAATALGGVGVSTGCSNTGELPEPPGSIGCDEASSADCAPQAPQEPPPEGDNPAPPPDEPSGEEPENPGDVPTPPPPPPPPGPGSTLWLEKEGTAQDDLALDAAVDASGDVYTVAVHGIDDLHTRQPTDDTVRLVLTRRAATGEKRWTRTFEVRTPETPEPLRAHVRASLAVDPAGGLLLAGNAWGTIDFETRELGDSAFIVRLDGEGRLQWANLPSGQGLTVADVTVDSQGRALVAFNTAGPADFGNGVRGSSATVVTYTPDGRAERALRVGRPESDADRVELTTLAVDGRGRLAVGGRYTGMVRFGGQTSTSSRQGSPFLALYGDGTSLAWAKALPVPGGVTQVGVDGQGTVVATGPFHGALTWAGKPLEGHAWRDSPFLLAADASGRERWGRNLGDGVQAGALAVDASGALVVAGFTYNRMEEGASGPDGLGSSQLVALRYGPDGGWLATRMFLSNPPETRGELYGLEALPSVLLLPGGDAVLFGHTDRDTDFGFGRRNAARGDVFLLRLMR